MPRALKVYRTHIGFDDLIIAAPSQKAALDAWGASPHLFAQGFAALTDEPDLVQAALARPGIVLRRQFGTKGDFRAAPPSLHLPPSPPKRPTTSTPRRSQPKAAPARPTAAERAAAKWAERSRAVKQAAAERAEQQAAEAKARNEARRREKEEQDAAAEARRTLHEELEALSADRRRQLDELEAKEKALARERREVEQSFETRMVALRKRLKKL